MPSIKIYPPSQLPDRKVNETQFSIWREELEVYLSQEEDFAVFLPGGWYANWTSAEANANRVAELSQLHRDDLADRRHEERHDQQNAQQDDDHDDAEARQARQQEVQRRVERQEASFHSINER